MAAKKATSSEQQILNTLETLRKVHKKDMDSCLSSIEELVFAVITDGSASNEEALKAIKNIKNSFVDWNEARVARSAELARQLDPIPGSDETAKRIKEALGKVFDRNGKVSFDFMVDMKISDARRVLNNIEPVGKAIADKILMLEVPGATIPFSNEAIALAKKIKLAPSNANRQSFNKLLSESTSRENSIELYYLLEKHIEKGCSKSKCPICKKS